jgi:hypothetical protein
LRSVLLLLFAIASYGAGASSSLAIVDAGIQPSEDVPFVNTDYQFLPGEYVYVVFHIAGYSVKIGGEKESRTMDISYTFAPQDAKGVPLVPPVSGDIKEQLGTEDKSWTPVKEASFLLPSFIADGQYTVRIVVKDILGETETEKGLPFHIRGPHIEPIPGINVQQFRFLREENAKEALDVPAYSPGDTVFTDFDIAGFALQSGNEYKVAYGVAVLRPDGKPFLDQPDAAELTDKSFYPAQYVPGTLNVLTTKTSPHGEYTILLTVRDLISGKTVVTRRAFSLE